MSFVYTTHISAILSSRPLYSADVRGTRTCWVEIAFQDVVRMLSLSVFSLSFSSPVFSVALSRCLKLLGHEIVFEVFQLK